MFLNLFFNQKEKPEPKTFQRGCAGTFFGLLHTVSGFLVTIFAVARILLIGYNEPFRYSMAMGIYNIAFESTSIILWLSGIGLLRGKRWGLVLGSVWGALSIFFHFSAHYIRKKNWGDFAPPLSWGDYIIIYYSVAFIAATVYIFYKERR